jgi:hypothetical protein
VVRSRSISGLLVSLALLLLISGCGGASPETRARQTKTARLGSQTPTLLSQEVVVAVDRERAVMLTAEAFLPVAPPPTVVGTVAASARSTMTKSELTDEMIAAAMAKAEARVCPPGDQRCYAFPYPATEAGKTCTAKGRCKVGWIVRAGGREAWDVWLEVSTGLVKLIRQTDA